MVDVSRKDVVLRTARAEGNLILSSAGVRSLRDGQVKKGDPLSTATAAALLAVKGVPHTIPHCHPVPVSSVSVEFDILDRGVHCTCTVSALYKTGVEIEALMGASVALLTIWDMVKYIEKDQSGQYPETSVTDLRVVLKTKEDV